ncbi:MAG: TrmH family RNA methyltransferase [Erythrobacter sp.]|uniref:TrmH family RNA methyltransferase n=1 Tax=Erythrobacter sp. TaxID=1042 RepID=UPI002633B31A|nr:TrmH family RNA methyltransferase [Erythrobacter sp.]MDJ0977516.1 TrmH family RNA methyltransferase [Erythrobacter sp.]
MLRCSDGTYYTGHTDDLDARVGAHHSGAVAGYTASRLPVELVWSQEFGERHEALAAELRIKGWSRAKKEALIMGDWDRLSFLARPPSERRGSASLANAPRLRSGRTDDEPALTSVRPEPVEGQSRAKPRLKDETNKPVIVLVRPQLGENIGKAARAMLNFGLTEMRLVAPRDGWPNPSAGPAAAGADIVLDQAQVFDTTAEAVADCQHVYATTVRKRGVTKPVVGADGAARLIHGEPGRHAVLFGPERSGLETEDVALARHILTVPINPEFGSLNLAQAVILAAYEWSRIGREQAQSDLVQPTADEELLPPAPQEELDGLIEHLESMLAPKGYFLPPDREEATRRTLRSVLTKAGWNHLEVRTLRGVLSSLGRPDKG